jgi:hypothetical protein
MTNKVFSNQANAHEVHGSNFSDSCALGRSILNDCAIEPAGNRRAAYGIAIFTPVHVPTSIMFPIDQIAANRWHTTILPHFEIGVR